MSDRLYYFDAYTMQFKAQVVERLAFKNKPAVVLDQSFFYPTSGGQPHDTGTLSDGELQVGVIDVFVRKEDGAVVHVLNCDGLADTVIGQIDWDRRFDHMQHHCGQHVLSRAFIDVIDAPTMSFHMGAEFCTIDIGMKELTKDQVMQVERLANQVVQENRPIEISEVTLDEARSMPIRKLPPVEKGLVRLVNITDFDLTACGGTHVERTGEIGLIKVTKLEKRKKMMRVEFLCGNRALADYDRKTDLMHDLTRQLSTGADSLLYSIEKLQDESKSLGREVRRLRSEQMAAVAERIKGDFEPVCDTQVLMHTFEDGKSVDDLRQIANILTSSENRIVLLGSAGEDARLVFCSSAHEKYHMGDFLRGVLDLIGAKSGGGQQTLAQGGGQPATAENVVDALQAVKDKIENNF